MINKGYLFVLVLGIIALLSSCSTGNFSLVLDESAPPDQNATVVFVNSEETGSHYLSKWNDIKIKKRLYGGRMKGNNTDVTLIVPAGYNKFTFDANIIFHGRSSNDDERLYVSRNVEIEYYFEPGKTYHVNSKAVETTLLAIFSKVELFVELYDSTYNDAPLKEWKITKSYF